MAKKTVKEEEKISQERGFSLINSTFFIRILKKAAGFMGAPGRIFNLITKAYHKSDNINSISSLGKKLKTQIFGLFELLIDFAKGNYKEVKVKDMILIIAGVIYLVSPLDLVPDFIPIIGLMDDISILTWIIATLSEEIDAYLLWKNHNIVKVKKKKSAQKIIEIS